MRKIDTIKIDIDKCTGCRTCEVVCSSFHAEPKFGYTNPKRSRIRVFRDLENDLYIPILAGQYTEAECNSRSSIIIPPK